MLSPFPDKRQKMIRLALQEKAPKMYQELEKAGKLQEFLENHDQAMMEDYDPISAMSEVMDQGTRGRYRKGTRRWRDTTSRHSRRGWTSQTSRLLSENESKTIKFLGIESLTRQGDNPGRLSRHHFAAGPGSKMIEDPKEKEKWWKQNYPVVRPYMGESLLAVVLKSHCTMGRKLSRGIFEDNFCPLLRL